MNTNIYYRGHWSRYEMDNQFQISLLSNIYNFYHVRVHVSLLILISIHKEHASVRIDRNLVTKTIKIISQLIEIG